MKRVERRTTTPRRSGLFRTATTLAWVCLAAGVAPATAVAQEVDIPDELLRAEIEDALGKASGETITVAEMESLTELRAENVGVKDLTGLEHATGLTELHLWYNDIVDLSPLADLTSLETLALSNNRIVDVSPLAGLSSLTLLRIANNRISDVSPLAGLSSLRWLQMSNNRVSDPTPLTGLASLTQLILGENQVSDLAPLSAMTSLTWLDLSGNGISDLSPLSGLTELDNLDLSHNEIHDLSPLSGLTVLRFLELQNNALSDVSPLSGLQEWLISLDLSTNAVSDLSPLSGLPLVYLYLKDNRISDVSPLSGLTGLESLHLTDNRISDLSPLSGLTSLYGLHLIDNRISDVSPLAGLTSLEHLHLPGNEISDISPLSGLTSVFDLGLADNQISDVSPLADLPEMVILDLADNQVSDLSPLADMTSLWWLALSGNAISDLAPLSGMSELGSLYLSRAGLSDVSSLSGMRSLTVLNLSGNAISDVSPLRGRLLLNVDLSDNLISDVSSMSSVFAGVVDLSDNQVTDISPLSGLVLVRLYLGNNRIEDLSPVDDLGNLERLDAAANEIVDVEPAASLANLEYLYLGGNAIADVTALANEPASLRGISLWRNPLDSDALDDHLTAMGQRGVAVTGGGWRVPYFPAPDGFRQGFIRVVSSVSGESLPNASDRGWIFASGQDAGPARLMLGARNARHFNSDDLVSGNRSKGLRSTIGADAGGRLDIYASGDIDVLSYVRTSDGFVTSMHDTVPWLASDHDRLDALRGRAVAESEGRAAGGHFVPIFNPASNTDQRSMLRLVNPSGDDVTVAVHAVDDQGQAAGPVRLTLPAHDARTLTAEDLESGGMAGLSGSLGDGTGKWRLVVSPSAEIHVMNLMSNPTGHLTSLSTSSDGGLTVPMFPAASHPTQQGFVRVANLSDTAGTAQIRGYDDAGMSSGPLVLQLPAGRTVHFNSNDWESGNADKGLEGAAGDGEGTWRLEFESSLDLVVSAYVRTVDGFLTSMHDLVDRDTCAVREVEGGQVAARRVRAVAFRPCRDERRVPFFNPASNTQQVSSLRLVNRGDIDAAVTIFGVDDEGAERGPATLALPRGTARTLTSLELESGDGDGLVGALGDGTGKWELRVFIAGEAARDVMVMSLLESPTGHLTNLSTWPDDELRRP